MRRILFHTIFAVITLTFFTACAARQTAAREGVATAAEIQRVLEEGGIFRFSPDYTGGFARRNFVYIAPDIITGRLPSSVFTPPGDYRMGALFTITDFESSVYYDPGIWLIRIIQNLEGEEVVHILEIRENGTATFGRESLTSRTRPFLVPIHGRVEVVEDVSVNVINPTDE